MQTNLPAEQTQNPSDKRVKDWRFSQYNLRQTTGAKAILGGLKYPIHNNEHNCQLLSAREIWHEVIVWQMKKCYNTCYPRLELNFCKVFTTFRCISAGHI